MGVSKKISPQSGVLRRVAVALGKTTVAQGAAEPEPPGDNTPPGGGHRPEPWDTASGPVAERFDALITSSNHASPDGAAVPGDTQPPEIDDTPGGVSKYESDFTDVEEDEDSGLPQPRGERQGVRGGSSLCSAAP